MFIHTRLRALTPSISREWLLNAAVVVLLGGFLTALFYAALPVGIDWRNAWRVAHDFRNYDNHHFIGIPLSLIFVPHVLLPMKLGNAVNLALNVSVPLLVIIKYKASKWAIAAVYLCPFFYVQLDVNNIDWLPLVGLLLPPFYGAALIAIKPQVIGGVLVVWLRRHGVKVMATLPIMALVILAIWGFTPLRVMRNADVMSYVWNFAPFPYLLPAGLFLLWQAWRNDDEFLAAGASPLLVPYIGGYTLPFTLTVVAVRYPKVAAFVSLLLWWVLIVQTRRAGLG